MKIVEEQVCLTAEDMTSFFEKVNWQPLFDFVKKEYGIDAPAKVSLNTKSHSFSVDWDENVADRCGILKDALSKAYLITFGSGFTQHAFYDDDKHQEFIKNGKFASFEELGATFDEIRMWCNIAIQYHVKDGGRHVVDLSYAEYTQENGWKISTK